MEKCLKAITPVFEYDTAKTVHIQSVKVGLLFRGVQLLILGYIIGYVIVFDKGYQDTDAAVSSVITKVKGSTVNCRDALTVDDCDPARLRVWDNTDLVVPAQEANAFFIVSNYVETFQAQTTFSEDPDASLTGSSRAVPCTSDDDCDGYQPSRNGVTNGQCDLDSPNGARCNVFGWGPPELIALDRLATGTQGYHTQLPNMLDFTVFIKSNVFFSKFEEKFTNTANGNTTREYLTGCLWDETDNYYCPVFRIRDMLAAAGVSEDEFNEGPLRTGAVVAIEIRYDCDLDSGNGKCPPTFKFTRIDLTTDVLSIGYNFRHAYYYGVSGQTPTPGVEEEIHRVLFKVYGVRFVFIVSGQAGKFSFIPLLIAFGSGLGLLSLATVVGDLLVTNVLKKKDYYAARKVELVPDDDEEYHAFLQTNGKGDSVPLLTNGGSSHT